MEILGYFLAVVMGLVLGITGGGGSILTVPIMVYVLKIDPVLATAYSLFVVGVTAAIGILPKSREGFVDYKTAFWFALPSLSAVFATRYYVIPSLPQEIMTWNEFTLSKEMAIMLFFAIIMLLAAGSMIGKGIKLNSSPASGVKIPLIILEGIIVGFVTGMVGAGGGFLIVPALVILVGLPIKKAVGTSLLIIAVKSLIGFLGDVGTGQEIDWAFLMAFSLFSLVGMVTGIYLTRFISSDLLRRSFGWFILVMGVLIFIREILREI